MLLGHPRIDADHRGLVELAGEIEAVADADDLPSLRDMVARLVGALTAHCAYEELEMSRLPRAVYGALVDEHQREHARMLATAAEMAESLRRGDGVEAVLHGCGVTMSALVNDLITADAGMVLAMAREGHLPE
jgi:hemerythrin